MKISFRIVVVLLLVPVALAGAVDNEKANPLEELNAESLVQEALQAEVDGDAERRDVLLADAREKYPDEQAARWHSGQLRVDDQWLSVRQAEQRASKAGVIDEYRQLRTQYAGSLAGELSLGRWCRKHELDERARLHWSNVLRIDPSNKEARTRLGVRDFRGLLLTIDQIEQWRQSIQDHQRVLKEWKPKLDRIRRGVEGSPLPHLTAAWEELGAIDDPSAVPSLEKLCHRSEPVLQRKVVSVLGSVEGQASTDALMRLAIHHQDSLARTSAAEQLGERSWYTFVPNLLNMLETPIQYRYVVNRTESSVFSQIRFAKEGPGAIFNLTQANNTYVDVRLQGRARLRPATLVLASIRRQNQVNTETAKQYQRLRRAVQEVETANARRNWLNERLFTALRTSTGQEYESYPRPWWDWWKSYNELEDRIEKPEYDYSYWRQYRRSITVGDMSCFAAGTLVWTDIGSIAIEDVRPGDRVLSQNPESGEISYRTVLDTTLRDPIATLRIQTADDAIVATPGHPFWVVGQGWRMAKELEPGDELHSVNGGVVINEIEPGPEVATHNLVVDTNNNYFVGNARLLVHDNILRKGVERPLPGWVASK